MSLIKFTAVRLRVMKAIITTNQTIEKNKANSEEINLLKEVSLFSISYLIDELGSNSITNSVERSNK
jgi:hypothetical protein